MGDCVSSTSPMSPRRSLSRARPSGSLAWSICRRAHVSTCLLLASFNLSAAGRATNRRIRNGAFTRG